MKTITVPTDATFSEKLPYFLANGTLLLAGYGIGTIIANLSNFVS